MYNTLKLCSGVAILIKPYITHSIITHTFIGDTLAIKIETSLGPIIIATNYSPPSRQFIPITDLNWLASHQTPAYLLADLNARHTSYCTSTNNYGAVLYNEWLRRGRFKRLGPSIGTFRNKRGNLTKPDIALSNSQSYHHAHCTTLPFNVSDHAPICLEISARAIKIPCPEFELNAKADWEQFTKILKDKIAPINLNLKDTHENENYVEFLEKAVKETKKLTIPMSKFKYSTKYSVTNKFKRLERVLREIHSLIDINTHNPAIIRNLNRNKALTIERIKIEANKINAKNWNDFLNQLNKDKKLDPRNFWNRVKPAIFKTPAKSIKITDTGTPQGKILTDPVSIERSFREEWSTHFIEPPVDKIDPEALKENREFHARNPDIATPYPVIDISRLNPDSPLLKPIKPIVVYLIIKSFENKAPGPDLIRRIQILHFPKIVFVNIAKIFNYALSTGKYPDRYKEGLMIFIPKPGKDASHPKNYRPITLINIIAKAFGKIINQRFVNYLESNALLNPLQYGFRKGRGCVSSLALMYELIARRKGAQYPYKVSVVSRDISGAFDRVWHDKLIQLFSLIIPEPLFVKLLSSFLLNRKIRIKISSYIGPPFTPSAGVPQGAPESPDIFNISTLPLDELVLSADTYAPWYCDDLHLIVTTPVGRRNRQRHNHQLKQAIINQNDFERKRGILTCPEKSIITSIGFLDRQDFEVNDGQTTVYYPHLAQKSTTKILGLNINNTSFTAQHVKKSCQRASAMLGEMSHLKKLSIPSKTLLVKSLILPVITYPCIPLNTCSLSCLYQLQTVQNDALRFIYNAHYPFLTSNRSLHHRANLPPINQVIHRRSKSTWEKIEAGEAGDLDTFNWIKDMDIYKHYNHFPSSYNLSLKDDPPPIYNKEDTRMPSALDFYSRYVDPP